MDTESIGTYVGIFLVIVLIGAGVYYGLQEVNKFMVRRNYGDRLATMCTTPNSSTFNLANGPNKPKPWRALVLEGEKKHSWHDELPGEAKADNRASTDVVVCVTDKHKQTVQECQYQSYGEGGGIFTISRVQYYRDLIVLNAETGNRVASLRVWGSAPNACTSQYVGTTNDEFKGDSPTDKDFYYVLMNLIWR